MVYKNFVVHPETVTDAHRAGCAASMQGKFKEFSNVFWEEGFGQYSQTRDPSKMNKQAILAMAGSIGLNTKKLAADMDGQACKDLIARDMAELSKFRVTGTPSFFVNGRFTMFSGPGPFRNLIEQELKIAQESGIPAAQYYQKAVLEAGLKTFRSKQDAATTTK